MRRIARDVVIDGESVRLQVARLTVAELDEVARFVGSRGTKPVNFDSERALQIDKFITTTDVSIDDRPARALGRVFGARSDILALLFFELLSCQQLTDEDRRLLEIATRFSLWLDQARSTAIESTWKTTGTNCAMCHELQLCERRGCNGVEQKHVWHDTKLVLKTCPVLSFTPETERILRLFYLTHQQSFASGVPQWTLVALPQSGGVADQEVWTMEALLFVHSVHVSVAVERAKRHGK